MNQISYDCDCDAIPEEERKENWATKYGFCCPKKYKQAMDKYRLWSDTDPHIDELSRGMKSARTKMKNKIAESLAKHKATT